MVNYTQNIWIPKKPLSHIFFDVDSTLSSIEGIDLLAEWNHVGQEVAAITELCMSKTGMNPEAYQHRLDLVKPTIDQINALSKLYITHLTEGAFEIISILHSFDKHVYIVSAGLKQALLPLATYLSISPDQTHAVDVFFTEQGDYQHFDNLSPLAQKEGKTDIIRQVCPSAQSVCLIGDGLSDLEAQSAVDRFIGFGGHQQRKAVQNESLFYVTAPHLFALLPLLLTQSEVEQLHNDQYQQYEKGLTAVDNQQVIFKELGNVQN